jgi:tetratricopeptide (TPR) repeat protein
LPPCFPSRRPPRSSAVRTSFWTALAVTAAGGLLGALYVLASRHATLADRTRRLVGAALLGLLAAAIAASIAAFFIAVDHPAAYAAAKWRHFKTLPSHERGSSHLTSLGSNRYDFWRVELRLARDHPLAGVGARGFAQRYLAQRRSTETPARGHSLELDTLAETGVVGLALLVAAVGTPLALALRRGRRNAVAAGLAAAGVYGVAHASVDWVWTFPAIGVPLFLLFGIAAAGNGPARLLHGVSAAAAGLVVLLVALLAFAPPWLSSRLTTHALRHPASASGTLRWAKRLDPLAVEPWLARASLARTPAGAVEALRRAVDREPGASNLRYLLGQAYLRAGDRVRARRSLELAHRLDPRDADIVKALRRARGR